MQTSQQASKTTKKILPDHSGEAARELIKISGSLLRLADRETQALVQNDLMTFAILQDEKELMTSRYTKASEEFRTRIEEFRTIDAATINKLDTIQRQLSEAARNNNNIVVRMRDRAKKKTHDALITAQELGQKHTINYITEQQDALAANEPAKEERI